MANDLELALADPDDLEALLELVAAYHRFEAIESPPAVRRRAVVALISDERLGRIWIARCDGRAVAYLAVCFGYSIEFGGRDAFVDEFFVCAEMRGRGIGRALLDEVAQRVGESGVAALHLEVAHGNKRAKAFYAGAGFEGRERYHLMSRRLD